MTATNFRDLLDPIEHFKASDGMWSTRILDADDLLARPVPWVDCPTCEGVSMVNDLRCDNCGASASLPLEMTCSNHLAKPTPCPTCTGTGKATVAQLLAWGSAVAEPLTDWGNYHLGFGDPAVDAVEDWRNRILGVQ